MEIIETLGLMAPGALSGAGAAAEERLRHLGAVSRALSGRVDGIGRTADSARGIAWESEAADLFRAGMAGHGERVLRTHRNLEEAAAQLELAGAQIRQALDGLATRLAAAREGIEQALHRETSRLVEGAEDLAGDALEAGRRALDCAEVGGARAAFDALAQDPLLGGVQSALAQAGVR